jgi:plasmid stabilization system protein ParE
MVRLKVFWTVTALKQRNHIFDYWNERNKSISYSKKLNTKIKSRINLIKTNPELGKKTEYKNTRAVSLGHYSILYKKVNTKIVVTGFWDNRKDPKKLIEYLKKIK